MDQIFINFKYFQPKDLETNLVFEPRNFFSDFFCTRMLLRQQVNNFLVGYFFFIAIGVPAALSLQSENDGISKSFLNTNTS